MESTPSRLSEASIARRSSDPQILGRSDDLQLAHRVASATKIEGRRSPSYIEQRRRELVEVDTEIFEYKLNDGNGMSSERAAELLKVYGLNELPEKNKSWLILILKILVAPMPLMIWAAIIILAAIEQWLDMGILLFIQVANASISMYEITKSTNAVNALKSTLEPHAQVKRDGEWKEITAKNLVPGDLVRLFSGRAVPADCRLHTSGVEVDQSQLTGESLPVTMFQGDLAKMGSTVMRGETEATVQFTGSYTYFGKTATLLGR